MSRLTEIAVYCPWARPYVSSHYRLCLAMHTHILQLMRDDL